MSWINPATVIRHVRLPSLVFFHDIRGPTSTGGAAAQKRVHLSLPARSAAIGWQVFGGRKCPAIAAVLLLRASVGSGHRRLDAGDP